MAREVLPLLFDAFDYMWGRVRARLDGLTTAEYLWEPVPGMWSVREHDGGWRIEREPYEPPDAAPVTTVAWRMWHIASDCLSDYVGSGLGERPLQLGEFEWFGEPGPALAAMDAAYASFRERVLDLGEDGVWGELGPSWGPFQHDPWAALVLHAQDEIVHHGAEIALLRDLYLRRA